MAAGATQLNRPRRTKPVRAVTGGAVGSTHFRSLGHENAVLAGLILPQQRGGGAGRTPDRVIMARSTKRRHLVGRGDAVRICPAARFAVAHACAVAGVAGETALGVRMAKKIRRGLRMTRPAQFVDRLLRPGSHGTEQQGQSRQKQD